MKIVLKYFGCFIPFLQNHCFNFVESEDFVENLYPINSGGKTNSGMIGILEIITWWWMVFIVLFGFAQIFQLRKELLPIASCNAVDLLILFF